MKIAHYTLIAALLFSGCVKPQKPAPVSLYGSGSGGGSAGAHTVIAGDTLYSISKRYRITLRDIAVTNRLAPPFALAAGQRLHLPPPQEYRVRAGDSVYTVSRLFSVGPSEIAKLNRLQSPYRLAPGQVLRMPSAVGRRPETRMAAISRPPVLSPLPKGGGKGEGLRNMDSSTAPPSPPAFAGAGSNPPPFGEGVYAVAVPPPLPPPRKSPVTAKTPKRSSGKFLRPVDGKILSSYGPKANGLHNDGINIAAPKGTPVRAAENGVVVYTGDELKGSGNLVLIRHADRWMSAYAHMSGLSVKRGDTVKRGQPIGTVGSSGSVDAPQLHFELRRGTEALNPQPYLEGKA